MNSYLSVTFIFYQGFTKTHMFFNRATWVRITENKILIHNSDNTFKEYRLKSITNLEITTIY